MELSKLDLEEFAIQRRIDIILKYYSIPKLNYPNLTYQSLPFVALKLL